jgi:hypothetical protein
MNLLSLGVMMAAARYHLPNLESVNDPLTGYLMERLFSHGKRSGFRRMRSSSFQQYLARLLLAIYMGPSYVATEANHG